MPDYAISPEERGSMNGSNIEQLEAKIGQVIERMRSLSDDSHNLEKENLELRSVLADKDRVISDLEARCEQYQADSAQSQPAASHSREIKKHLSSVLKKVDQLESLI